MKLSSTETLSENDNDAVDTRNKEAELIRDMAGE
jgi:hypothetical protein